MSSVWYTIIFHSHKDPCYEAFLHVAFTNWAALDAFRLFTDQAKRGQLTACFVTTYYGSATMILQQVFIVASSGVTAWRARKPTLFLLRWGQILPSYAIWILVTDFTSTVRDEDPPRAQIFRLHNQADWISCLMIVVILCAIMIMMWRMSERNRTRFTPLMTHPWRITTIASAINLLAPLPLLVVSATSTIDLPLSCFVKPCAPQSIAESDQAYALTIGILLFVWQIGSDVYNLWERALRLLDRFRRGNLSL